MAQWIDVEEELPPANVPVLVYGVDGYGRPKIGQGAFNYKMGWTASLGCIHYWTEYPNVPALHVEAES